MDRHLKKTRDYDGKIFIWKIIFMKYFTVIFFWRAYFVSNFVRYVSNF